MVNDEIVFLSFQFQLDVLTISPVKILPQVSSVFFNLFQFAEPLKHLEELTVRNSTRAIYKIRIDITKEEKKIYSFRCSSIEIDVYLLK